jgi:ABC-type transport system involved in multi-copper enzyme maturation permease subunit
VTALVLADLRARWRSLAGIGTGCLALLILLASTYKGFGGAHGMAQNFGAGGLGKVMAALTGSSSTDIFGPAHFLGFGFAHPFVLTLAVGAAVSNAAGAIAADVETGRAEMLYTAPVTRTAILAARVTGWLIAEIFVLTCAIAGELVGSRMSPELSGTSPAVPFRVAVQFGSLLFFLGAAAFAASARARTRGVALGIAIAVAAGSYAANLVSLLWSPAGFLHHLNPFGYYNSTSAADRVNWADAGLLVSAGTLLLLLSRHWLERRDLT